MKLTVKDLSETILGDFKSLFENLLYSSLTSEQYFMIHNRAVHEKFNLDEILFSGCVRYTESTADALTKLGECISMKAPLCDEKLKAKVET